MLGMGIRPAGHMYTTCTGSVTQCTAYVVPDWDHTLPGIYICVRLGGKSPSETMTWGVVPPLIMTITFVSYEGVSYLMYGLPVNDTVDIEHEDTLQRGHGVCHCLVPHLQGTLLTHVRVHYTTSNKKHLKM